MSWSPETMERARALLTRYPDPRSAVMPLLYLGMAEEGRVTLEGMRQTADLVGLTPAQVQAVASFYSMFKREETGRYLISVCTSISCMLRGGEEVLAMEDYMVLLHLQELYGKGIGGTRHVLRGEKEGRHHGTLHSLGSERKHRAQEGQLQLALVADGGEVGGVHLGLEGRQQLLAPSLVGDAHDVVYLPDEIDRLLDALFDRFSPLAINQAVAGLDAV